jgi:hypothetical protein
MSHMPSRNLQITDVLSHYIAIHSPVTYDQLSLYYVEIHTDDPPVISSTLGVNLDRIMDNILYALGKSDVPL